MILLAASGRSINRAHLAAGLAAAVSRQGIVVSLLEVCRGLPTTGYYFGLDPADHLAPSLVRSRLVSGVWNDTVRYCMSGDPRSFAEWRPAPVSGAMPHALVAAFPRPATSRAAPFLMELARTVGPFAVGGGTGSVVPDAVLVAGDGAGAPGWESFVPRLRSLFPEALLLRLAHAPVDLGGADEGVEMPDALVSSWARRLAPVDPFFNDLVSGLFQVLSRRRRAAHDAAAG